MKHALLAIFLIVMPMAGCSTVKSIWSGVSAGTEQASEQQVIDRLLVVIAAQETALLSLEAAVDAGFLTGTAARRALDAEEAVNTAVEALSGAYADGKLSVASDFGDAYRLIADLIRIVEDAKDAS